MKENKLLASINNYIQGMHVVFNDINISEKEIWEEEHCDIQKKIELGFEIGLPANETQFSKTVTKKDFFFPNKLLSMLAGSYLGFKCNFCFLLMPCFGHQATIST